MSLSVFFLLFAEVTCSSNQISSFVDFVWDFVSSRQLNLICFLLLRALWW